MKAVYKGCVYDGWEHVELFYEYRGHEYVVTKHNNGHMDKSLKQQHKEAQAEIDYKIEHENEAPQEWEYEGSAQEAFDKFWEMVNE